MKVRVISKDAHDTTVGKVYQVVGTHCLGTVDGVWITDDVGERYVLWNYEYEVVEE